jgi:hypothetical protein
VERLGTDDPMVWLTIPIEHEPLLADIHRALDSEASVRLESTAQLPQTEELPIIQDAAPIEQKPHTESQI